MKKLEHCPICGSDVIEKDYEHSVRVSAQETTTWSVSKCMSCTHGFVNPQPNWEELAVYYAESYRPYRPHHGAWQSDEDVLREARHKGELRHTPIRNGVRILDVGCGGGYFLRLATQLGAITEGVEPSAQGAEETKRQGITCFEGKLEDYTASQSCKQFDIITANHVIEHLPDPVMTLTTMRGLLATDGLIVIAVPNAKYWACRSLQGYWHSADVPRHLMQFNSVSLRQCGERAGLHVDSLKTESLQRGVASSIRQWLRRRMLIPSRVSSMLTIIDGPVARNLGKALDGKSQGEALVVHFRRRDP